MFSNVQRIGRYIDFLVLVFAGWYLADLIKLIDASAGMAEIAAKAGMVVWFAVLGFRTLLFPEQPVADPVPPAKDTFLAWLGRSLCSVLLLCAGAAFLFAWGLHIVGMSEKSALYVLLAVFLAFAGWQRRPKLPMPPASYETDADELRIIETLAGDLLDATDEPRAKMYANEIASGLFDRGWRKVAKELLP